MSVINKIKSVNLSGKLLLPIIEGGKGIGITNGITAGNFAKFGAVGTFSGVNADYLDENGNLIPVVYRGKTRRDKHEELVAYGINGGISQAKIARDISGGNGKIHMNVLWEMGGAERVLEGILERAHGLIDGITCGAGMPYRLAEIAKKYKVYYYPIVSSMRAFRALWKRSYSHFVELLGGVVYECPWRAGGHNGLSNAEDPTKPQDPYPRIVEIRQFMDSVGLQNVPIIMAGGVWNLEEYSDWLDNKEVGKIAFQFGTRPIVTKEYPVSDEWKKILLNLKEGDVYLNKFSPTGFYSSAIRNDFLQTLIARSSRQLNYSESLTEEFNYELKYGVRDRVLYIKNEDKDKALHWIGLGFSEIMKTPDYTIVFVEKDEAKTILKDQADCMGCLSQCSFSNWSQHSETNYTTDRRPDPRSFCIQKTLQNAKDGNDIKNQLMFSGSNAFRFSTDPFYKDDFIPTIGQLIDRIMQGK